MNNYLVYMELRDGFVTLFENLSLKQAQKMYYNFSKRYRNDIVTVGFKPDNGLLSDNVIKKKYSKAA